MFPPEKAVKMTATMKAEKKENRQITSEELMRLNPERKPLTVEKLRELSGLKNLSDEEAQEIIFSIRTFCAILLELAKEKEPVIHSIELNINQQKLAA